jgi:hypothetical protein
MSQNFLRSFQYLHPATGLFSGKGDAQKKYFSGIFVVISTLVYLIQRFVEQRVDFLFGMILYLGDNGQSGLFPDKIGASELVVIFCPYIESGQSHPHQYCCFVNSRMTVYLILTTAS